MLSPRLVTGCSDGEPGCRVQGWWEDGGEEDSLRTAVTIEQCGVRHPSILPAYVHTLLPDPTYHPTKPSTRPNLPPVPTYHPTHPTTQPILLPDRFIIPTTPSYLATNLFLHVTEPPSQPTKQSDPCSPSPPRSCPLLPSPPPAPIKAAL